MDNPATERRAPASRVRRLEKIEVLPLASAEKKTRPTSKHSYVDQIRTAARITSLAVQRQQQ
jgi:hypothetical protein